MELPVLLQYVSDALGLESLELNEHGVMSLRFNDSIDLHIEPDPDDRHCHLYSQLCRVPDDAGQRLALFEALLSANCFGRGSGGATFSVDDHNREVLLGRQFDLTMTDPQQLQDWMLSVLTNMEVWRQRLPDILGQSSNPSPEVVEDVQYFRP